MTRFQHLTTDCGHHCIFIMTPTLQEQNGAGIVRHCACPECHGRPV